MYENVLQELELNCILLPNILVKNDQFINYFGNHLKSRNFIQYQCASTAFHPNKQKYGIQHKFTLHEGPIYAFNFIFCEISPNIEKSLKLQLN